MKILRKKMKTFGFKMDAAKSLVTGDITHMATGKINRQLGQTYSKNLTKANQAPAINITVNPSKPITPTGFIGN